MTLRVTSVQPLDGYVLRLAFNDGAVREVDVSYLLRGELGEPLRDLVYFRKVRVDRDARTIVWPNGLDPDPEMLYRGGDGSYSAASTVSAASPRV